MVFLIVQRLAYNPLIVCSLRGFFVGLKLPVDRGFALLDEQLVG